MVSTVRRRWAPGQGQYGDEIQVQLARFDRRAAPRRRPARGRRETALRGCRRARCQRLPGGSPRRRGSATASSGPSPRSRVAVITIDRPRVSKVSSGNWRRFTERGELEGPPEIDPLVLPMRTFRHLIAEPRRAGGVLRRAGERRAARRAGRPQPRTRDDARQRNAASASPVYWSTAQPYRSSSEVPEASRASMREIIAPGPAGTYCVSLDGERRAALRAECFRRLGEPWGPFTLSARAWAVRGVA
jgi:hypothetical protein